MTGQLSTHITKLPPAIVASATSAQQERQQALSPTTTKPGNMLCKLQLSAKGSCCVRAILLRGKLHAQGTEPAGKPEMVDRACSPFVFPTADDANAEQAPGRSSHTVSSPQALSLVTFLPCRASCLLVQLASHGLKSVATGTQPTRIDDTAEVLEVEQTAAVEDDGLDGSKRQRGSARRSSSSLQALKDRRTSSLRRIQTTSSYRGSGSTAFTAGSDVQAFGGGVEDMVQDPAAKVSARLAKLHFARQFSADERDDQHALSLTNPMSEATADAEVRACAHATVQMLDPLCPTAACVSLTRCKCMHACMAAIMCLALPAGPCDHVRML